MLDILASHPNVVNRASLASSALSLYAFWPYIRDVLLGHTQPERASWLIWSVLSTVSLLSQMYEGADRSLGFAATQTAGTLIICGLAFWKTNYRRFTSMDSYALTATAVGIWLWAEMENAGYALMVTISISMIGGIITMQKTLRHPNSETWATWIAFFVSGGLALVAVGAVDWLLLAYPLYVMILSGGIMLCMWFGHRNPRNTINNQIVRPRQRLTLNVMSPRKATRD